MIDCILKKTVVKKMLIAKEMDWLLAKSVCKFTFQNPFFITFVEKRLKLLCKLVKIFLINCCKSYKNTQKLNFEKQNFPIKYTFYIP